MVEFPNYEGYEDLGRFTPSQLQSYRQMLLDKTKPMTDLIFQLLWDYIPLEVVEVGCGNGRLLIDMAKRRMLQHGYGIDLSRSRIDFAKQWAIDESLTEQLLFDDTNVLDWESWPGHTDDELSLAICITGCFQYFEASSLAHSRTLLRYMKQAAKHSLFELYKQPPMGPSWKKLAEGDSWNYLLDNYEKVEHYIKHTKTFIGHDGTADTRVENLVYYTLDDFTCLLRDRGGYANMLYTFEDKERLVILAS